MPEYLNNELVKLLFLKFSLKLKSLKPMGCWHKFIKIRFDKTHWFYLVLFCSLWLLFAYLKVSVNGGMFRGSMWLPATTDASLFFFICLCFRGKWKYVSLAIPVLLGVFIFANALYCRYFNDFISASMYRSLAVFNDFTLKGSSSVLSWWDLLLMLFAFAPVTYVLCINRKALTRANPKWWWYVADIILIVVCWAFTFIRVYNNYKGGLEEGEDIFVFFEEIMGETVESNTLTKYRNLHFTGYAIKILANLKNNQISLSAEDKSLIKFYIEKKNSQHKKYPQDIFSRPENLVLIVVESLPSALLHSELAQEVAPTLKELASDTANVYVDLKDITSVGASSDAKFIYNTGLLPLNGEALVLRYGVKDYPSIAKALGVTSLELLGENGYIWNQHATSRSYGFDKLIDNLQYPQYYNTDSLIFKKARKELSVLSSPFYMSITTLSMHSPYVEPLVTHRLDTRHFGLDNPCEIEYLQRVNLFDRQLKLFLDELKRKGLYDKTLIVIAGDHRIPERGRADRFKDDHVPMIIINAPFGKVTGQNFTQADLFPTILDVFNIDYRYNNMNYSGLGRSVFECGDRDLTPEDYRVSTMLIKGNY